MGILWCKGDLITIQSHTPFLDWGSAKMVLELYKEDR